MFAPRYFAKRYFAGRFWPKVADGTGPVVVDLSADLAGSSGLSAALEFATELETAGGFIGLDKRRKRRRDEEDLLIMMMAA